MNEYDLLQLYFVILIIAAAVIAYFLYWLDRKGILQDVSYFFLYVYYMYLIPWLRKKAIIWFHFSGEKRDKFLARYGGRYE